jgi:putative hemolysin
MAFGNELLLIFALTLVNGFFSGAEIGLLSVRRTRLQELADDGRRAARSALALRDDPERLLATVQVGITFVGATASAFGGATLAAPLARWLEGIGVHTGADQLALAIVVTLVSVLSIVLGELVPKSLALRSSERVSLLVAPGLRLISRLARPLVWFLTSLSNVVLRPFQDQTSFSESRLSPDELQTMVEEASTAGSLSPAVGDIASRALDLEELPITALMIPRKHVIALRMNATYEEAWTLMKRHPHARYPVVEQDLDTVAGYVVARELIVQLVERNSVDVRSVTREIPTFAERTPAVQALRKLQNARSQLAAVIDEHGMTSGIVTVTDIAEELLGDILSEHDRPSESIREERPGVALVRADTPIQEINRELDLELELSHEYATLSGLLMHASTRIMQPGEKLTIDDIEFEVIEGTPRQVKLVRVVHGPALSEPSPSP